jgi:hypothetical protein
VRWCDAPGADQCKFAFQFSRAIPIPVSAQSGHDYDNSCRVLVQHIWEQIQVGRMN